MDLNIHYPHFTIDDAHNWYREMIHGQLLRIGERLYGDPATGMQYSFLRAEPEKPTCDRHPNIDAQVKEQMKANASDDFASFFGAASESDVRASLLAAQQQCEEKYQAYDKTIKYIEANPEYVLIVRSKQVSLVFLNSVQRTVPFYWSLWY